eukprot:4759858-Pleurochrysis_carterae.AAC.1
MEAMTSSGCSASVERAVDLQQRAVKMQVRLLNLLNRRATSSIEHAFGPCSSHRLRRSDKLWAKEISRVAVVE